MFVYTEILLYLLVLFLAVLLLFKTVTRNFDYWKKRGVYYVKPLPLVGNAKDVFLMRITLGNWLRKLYDTVKRPYFGIFIFNLPCLVVTDPVLIKHILIKDFNTFRNRTVASGDHNEVMRDMLFFQKEPKWKITRRQISPIYATGRLKKMFSIMNKIGIELVKYMEGNLGDVNDIKELVATFSMETISQTTFGLRLDCFYNKNHEFLQYGERIFECSIRNSLVQICYFIKQDWVDSFKLIFFPKDVLDYFVNIFLDTMRLRRESGSRLNDLIDIFNDIKSDEKLNLSDTALAAAAFQIFLGGYETTATTISFVIHELSLNLNIQRRLRSEIFDAIGKYGGITYEALSEMKYMDMCIDETLRKYPILPFLDRLCGEDYVLPGTDVLIEKGTSIYIPLSALHLDEKYFPHPLKFDPERFQTDPNLNKENIIYMPFGQGPRICFGLRFGMLVTKTCLCHFLTNFEVAPSLKTQRNVEMSIKSQLALAEGGLPLRISKYIANT